MNGYFACQNEMGQLSFVKLQVRVTFSDHSCHSGDNL